jgi:hypothetical protein
MEAMRDEIAALDGAYDESPGRIRRHLLLQQRRIEETLDRWRQPNREPGPLGSGNSVIAGAVGGLWRGARLVREIANVTGCA